MVSFFSFKEKFGIAKVFNNPDFIPLSEKVNAGIRLLNQRCGHNWVYRIDLNILDIKSPWIDILGQLYGTYVEGVDILKIAGDTFLYGLNGLERDCPKLNELWRKKITKIKKRRVRWWKFWAERHRA